MSSTLTHEETIKLCDALPDGFYDLNFLDSRTLLIIDVINHEEPEFLPLIARLSHSGSDPARRKAINSFSAILSMVSRSSAMNESPPTRGIKVAVRELAHLYSGPLCWIVQFAWNFANVALEANIPDDGELRAYEDRVVRATGRQSSSHDWYWRGVSALALTTDILNLQLHIGGVNEEFIEWAGTHDDIGKVIKFAKERDTKDVDTLRDLMNLNALAPTLGEGNL